MQFKLKDYLNTLNVGKHQWYSWAKAEGDREVYAHLIVNHSEAIKPTEQECINGVAKMQSDYDAQDYARKRLDEYPTIGDQFDMLWHGMDSGALPKIDSFYDAIKAIKAKYPKP